MEIYLILFAVLLFIFTVAGVITWHLFRKMPKYPPYYRDVMITWKYPKDKHLYKGKAWLAVNDNLEYIWTLSDGSEKVISDDYVINWSYI